MSMRGGWRGVEGRRRDSRWRRRERMGLSGGGGAEGGGGAVGEPEGAGVSTARVEGGCLCLRVGAGAGAEGGFAAAALMTGKGWGVCFRLRGWHGSSSCWAGEAWLRRGSGRRCGRRDPRHWGLCRRTVLPGSDGHDRREKSPRRQMMVGEWGRRRRGQCPVVVAG